MSENKKRPRFPFRRKQKTPKGNYAFIDSQNLNLGVQAAGWKMDWKKFRIFLKDKYNVDKAFMFIGYMPENEDLYNQMHDAGYLVALKPTLEMFSNPDEEDKENKLPTKGNVDAELVMYAMKELQHFKKAIIVSGDGDFYSLIEYLKDKDKLLHVMVPNWKYSTLLKPFENFVVRLDEKRAELAYASVRRNQQRQRHSKKARSKSGS